MMARSTPRSKQRPDTLTQDRICRIDENLLQRTAGPYIWVNRVILNEGWPLPVYLGQRTSSEPVDMSQTCQEETCAGPMSLPQAGCLDQALASLVFSSRNLPLRHPGR